MRRVSALVPCIPCFLLSSQLLCPVPSAAQQRTPPPLPPTRNNQVRSFSVNGRVTDAATNAQLDYVKIELHSITGGVVGTAFTSGSGGFQLNNVSDGDYTLVADKPGYQTVSVQVEVNGASVYGIQVDLPRPPDTSTPVNKGPAAVSLRELSIPPKAHDDMENPTTMAV